MTDPAMAITDINADATTIGTLLPCLSAMTPENIDPIKYPDIMSI